MLLLLLLLMPLQLLLWLTLTLTGGVASGGGVVCVSRLHLLPAVAGRGGSVPPALARRGAVRAFVPYKRMTGAAQGCSAQAAWRRSSPPC